MAESKRTFQSAKMDKDIDDRLLPAGTYRDALNVSVEFSEDGNVGALENLKGNELLASQDITGLSSSSNPNAKVIGSIAHPEENKIYYFVTGDKSDGIFEYDATTGDVSTIIIESSEAPPTTEQLLFEFPDALAQALVAINGDITLTAQKGEIEAITKNFGETVSSAKLRKISARVRVPSGYSNEGEYVYGELTATQQPIAAPPAGSVQTLEPTNIDKTTVTLNGKYTQDAAALTDIGFYYVENTSGTASLDFYSNKHVITKLVGGGANISSGAPLWTDPFNDVEASDITVIDANGNTVSSSNYTYERFSGPQPSTIQFSGTLPALPITVAQTSSSTTISNAKTVSEIVSDGTQVSLSSAITSPFKKDITGLTVDTKYVFVAYATNTSGTTYGEPVTFETAEAFTIHKTWPAGEFLMGTVTGIENSRQNAALGYGTLTKQLNGQSLGTFVIVAKKNETYSGATGYAWQGGSTYDDDLNFVGNLSFSSVSGAATQVKELVSSGYGGSGSAGNGELDFRVSKSGFDTQTFIYNNGQSDKTMGITLNGVYIAKGSNLTVNTYYYYKYNTSANSFTFTDITVTPFYNNAGYFTQVIPLNNTATEFTSDTDQPFKSSFDKSNLSVTMSGLTSNSRGIDWDYYVEDASSAVNGRLPGIILKVKWDKVPSTGSTVTITYS
jgi:hypothetical protein